MTEINASPGRIIQLGYEGEDKVTTIIFRYDSEWLSHGEGVFKIRVLRHGDAEAYNATEVIDDRENMTLTMTITDIELSSKGHGEMQVVYIGSNFVKKSPIYRYNVSRSIDSEIVNPPTPEINIESLTITENGTYTAGGDVDGYSPIVVNVPIPEPSIESLTVTENGTYTATGDGYNPVVVNVPAYVPVTEALSVTANGTYTPGTGVDGFSSVTVNVPEPEHQTETWTFTLDDDSTITKVVILDE